MDAEERMETKGFSAVLELSVGKDMRFDRDRLKLCRELRNVFSVVEDIAARALGTSPPFFVRLLGWKLELHELGFMF